MKEFESNEAGIYTIMHSSESKSLKTNIRAFGNRVLVLEIKTEGGVILPQGYSGEDFYRGTIVEGNDALNSFVEQWVPPKIGDIIYFRGGYKINDHWVVELSDIIAVEVDG